jgi:hypothetical protein
VKHYLLVLLLSLSFISKGQELIRGMVVDSATFAALPYVSVQVKNTLRGTTTDIHGSFSIQAKETDTLTFSLVGYERMEFPLFGYEAGMIRMREQPTLLAPVIIHDNRISPNPYEGMFDEQNARLKKKIPFYYHKTRKDKIKAANWRDEVLRVQTYVDLIINSPETKNELSKKHSLTENEYYELLAAFNSKHYEVMYYLTKGELLTLINRFFEEHASVK